MWNVTTFLVTTVTAALAVNSNVWPTELIDECYICSKEKSQSFPKVTAVLSGNELLKKNTEWRIRMSKRDGNIWSEPSVEHEEGKRNDSGIRRNSLKLLLSFSPSRIHNLYNSTASQKSCQTSWPDSTFFWYSHKPKKSGLGWPQDCRAVNYSSLGSSDNTVQS